MHEQVGLSYMKEVLASSGPIRMPQPPCAVWRSTRAQSSPSHDDPARASSYRTHQCGADLGEMLHHREGGIACSKRDLRQTYQHQSQDRCKGVEPYGPIRPLVRWPPGNHATLLRPAKQSLDVPLTAERLHNPASAPQVMIRA